MNKINDSLQQLAGKLLSDKAVDVFIGYELGSEATKTTPVFISDPSQTARLVFNPFSVNSLVRYLQDFKGSHKKVGLVVKGCDSRGVNRLVNDKQFKRDEVVVIGVPCPGMLDGEKAKKVVDPAAIIKEVADQGDKFLVKTDKGDYTLDKKEYQLAKCATCESPDPVVYDHLAGDLKNKKSEPDYTEIAEFEKKSTQEKNAFWEEQFSKCIRCYACRNVCPACTCTKCVFDSAEPVWIGKQVNNSENAMFQLTRAMHTAGRCIDCGECERVCPMDLPIRLLNRKVLKDSKDLFNAPTPGSAADTEAVLGYYKHDDPEEFM